MSVPKNFLSPPANYDDCLSNLKERIRRAQTHATLAVNQELILLYWQIGWEILSREREQGWGAGVVERLARDLKREFPAMKGFSARNIRYYEVLGRGVP
jgi:predicted nuclease of restriction endonuclease-like (RecB) superfamily